MLDQAMATEETGKSIWQIMETQLFQILELSDKVNSRSRHIRNRIIAGEISENDPQESTEVGPHEKDFKSNFDCCCDQIRENLGNAASALKAIE